MGIECSTIIIIIALGERIVSLILSLSISLTGFIDKFQLDICQTNNSHSSFSWDRLWYKYIVIICPERKPFNCFVGLICLVTKHGN